MSSKPELQNLVVDHKYGTYRILIVDDGYSYQAFNVRSFSRLWTRTKTRSEVLTELNKGNIKPQTSDK